MEIWDLYTREGEPTGRTMVRGDRIPAEHYHLVVHFWLQNAAGEYLVQKRADHVAMNPGIWATTGGSAISGEDSRTTVIREVEEEIGWSVPEPEELCLLQRYVIHQSIVDVWLLEKEVPLSAFEPGEEVAAVAYHSEAQIRQKLVEKRFWNYGEPYFRWIFDR